MMKSIKKNNTGRMWRLILFCILILMIFHQKSDGQEKPPRPIELLVKTEQGLQFGAFTYGLGTVTITPQGGRTQTGDVILVSLGHTYTPAWIQVKGNIGTLVTININPSSIRNGGYSVPLTFTNPIPISSPSSPFIITTNNWMDIFIGGTLTVGSSSANPAGSYSGSFDVIFIQN